MHNLCSQTPKQPQIAASVVRHSALILAILLKYLLAL